MSTDAQNGPTNRLRDIPRGIWALGFVSMFMDISSEMIHSLLPVYLVTVLGTSALTVGFIEGIAEATASVTKIFSGALSDYLGKRKLLAAIGYGVAAFTKPVFPLAPTAGWLIAARFIDRVGKGIRGAPRDALIADIAPAHLRGACFGLRQSLDTVGAFIGPLAATALMVLTLDDFTLVFWLAVIPAFVALALMIFGVEEPRRTDGKEPERIPIKMTDVRGLAPAFWLVVLVGAVLTLARFSEAFLVLRAQNVGLAVAFVPVVLIVMNVVYALSAYPAGRLSDRINRKTLLAAGFVVLVLSDIVLASASGIVGVLVGVVLWGLHMGITQGLLSRLVADTTPQKLRGTAFGLFNLFSGVAMLAASIIAGILWDFYGPSATFIAGAGFTVLALAGLMVVRRPSGSSVDGAAS